MVQNGLIPIVYRRDIRREGISRVVFLLGLVALIG